MQQQPHHHQASRNSQQLSYNRRISREEALAIKAEVDYQRLVSTLLNLDSRRSLSFFESKLPFRTIFKRRPEAVMSGNEGHCTRIGFQVNSSRLFVCLCLLCVRAVSAGLCKLQFNFCSCLQRVFTNTKLFFRPSFAGHRK